MCLPFADADLRLRSVDDLPFKEWRVSQLDLVLKTPVYYPADLWFIWLTSDVGRDRGGLAKAFCIDKAPDEVIAERGENIRIVRAVKSRPRLGGLVETFLI